MTDTSTRVAGISNDRLENCTEFSLAAGAAPGTVIAATSTGPAKARANAAGTSNVLGVNISASAADEPGFAKYAGPVTLTAAQWDAIAGTTGGLTPGAYYYLSAATAGLLTDTPPSTEGQFVTPVGLALDATTLLVQISPPTAV